MSARTHRHNVSASYLGDQTTEASALPLKPPYDLEDESDDLDSMSTYSVSSVTASDHKGLVELARYLDGAAAREILSSPPNPAAYQTPLPSRVDSQGERALQRGGESYSTLEDYGTENRRFIQEEEAQLPPNLVHTHDDLPFDTYTTPTPHLHQAASHHRTGRQTLWGAHRKARVASLPTRAVRHPLGSLPISQSQPAPLSLPAGLRRDNPMYASTPLRPQTLNEASVEHPHLLPLMEENRALPLVAHQLHEASLSQEGGRSPEVVLATGKADAVSMAALRLLLEQYLAPAPDQAHLLQIIDRLIEGQLLASTKEIPIRIQVEVQPSPGSNPTEPSIGNAQEAHSPQATTSSREDTPSIITAADLGPPPAPASESEKELTRLKAFLQVSVPGDRILRTFETGGGLGLDEGQPVRSSTPTTFEKQTPVEHSTRAATRGSRDFEFELKNAEIELESVKALNRTLKATVETVTSESERVSHQWKQATARNTDLIDQLEGMQKRVKALERVQLRVEELEARLAGMAHLEHALETQTAQCLALETSLKAEQDQHAARETLARKDHERLQRQAQEAEAQVAELRAQARVREAATAALEQRHNALLAATEKAQVTNTLEKSRLEDQLRKAVEATLGAMAAQAAAETELRDEIEAFKTALTLKAAKEEATTTAAMRAAVDTHAAEVTRLQLELAAEVAQHRDATFAVQQDLEECRARFEALRHDLAATQSGSGVLIKELEETRQELKQTRHTLELHGARTDLAANARVIAFVCALQTKLEAKSRELKRALHDTQVRGLLQKEKAI